jgi:hypothetical protein
VRSQAEAEYVRGYLQGMRFDCTDPKPEPTAVDPPFYGFLATPQADSTITAPELQAVLERDQNIALTFGPEEME